MPQGGLGKNRDRWMLRGQCEPKRYTPPTYSNGAISSPSGQARGILGVEAFITSANCLFCFFALVSSGYEKAPCFGSGSHKYSIQSR